MITLPDLIRQISDTGKYVLVYAKDITAIVEIVDEKQFGSYPRDGMIKYRTLNGTEGYIRADEIFIINPTNKTKEELEKEAEEEIAEELKDVSERTGLRIVPITKKETTH